MLDFLFVYEHKVRELNSICLLRMELENRGYQVEFVQLHDLHMLKYATVKKPKVLVVFSLWDDFSFDTAVTAIVGRINKVVNLQWEQASSKERMISGQNIPKGNCRYVVHTCWGRAAYDQLTKGGIKNAVITGDMQMDLLRGNIARAFQDRSDLNRQYDFPSKKMILFISTFPLASMSDREIKINIKYTGDAALEEEWLSKRSRPVILEWLCQLLREREDYFVVYRPHPAEYIDDELKTCLENTNNFYIIRDYSVIDWVLAADIVTTWRSTSLAEIYFSGKGAFILRPIKIETDKDIILYDGASFITSYEQLSSQIERSPSFPGSKDIIEYYYGSRDEEFAYIRTADLLEDVFKTEKYNYSFHIKISTLWIGEMKRIIKSIILKLKIRGNLWPLCKIERLCSWLDFFWEAEKKYADDQTSKTEIENRISFYRNLLKQNN